MHSYLFQVTACRIRPFLHKGTRFCRLLSTSTCLQPQVAMRLERQVSTAELFFDAKARVGGAPFYDRKRNQLLWVDTKSRTINILDVATRKNESILMHNVVGAALPVVKSDNLVVLIGRRICLVDRTGSIVKELSTIEHLEINDTLLHAGKCDRLGRLWCGTGGLLHLPNGSAATMGALYSFRAVKGQLKEHPTGMSILNGLEWNKEYSRMFCTDAQAQKVYAFDYSESEGEIGRQEILVDYGAENGLGHPSGVCRDTGGNLWIAGYLGGNVACWDATGSEMLSQIEVPAKRVTACCFGGPDRQWLFITTAREEATDAELEEFPHSGGIFVVKEPGAKGERMPKLRTETCKISIGN